VDGGFGARAASAQPPISAPRFAARYILAAPPRAFALLKKTDLAACPVGAMELSFGSKKGFAKDPIHSISTSKFHGRKFELELK